MKNRIVDTKMMSFGVAKTKAYNQLRMISEPLPNESPAEHDNRVNGVVMDIIYRAIYNDEIDTDLLIENFVSWDINFEIMTDSGNEEFLSYETSYVNRDQFMQFVNNTAPDLLVLKDDSDEMTKNVYGHSSADRKLLGELKLEKEKWDASIVAAVKVGLLFYENGLEKPVSKESFIKGFTDHLGDGLPDSTIEKIYRALPSGYRLVGGRPKKNATDKQMDINTIIKAAVYAGSIYDTDDAKDVVKLRDTLLDAEYDVPDDDHLKVIVAAVKDT